MIAHNKDADYMSNAIAIIGIGCRFPGDITNAESFWNFVAGGNDAISEVPENRWAKDLHYHADPLHPLTHHVNRGGFIGDIDKFDASFFGISPREAVCMDPQQRLLMEVSWGALEDAGYPLDAIRGSDIGVFVGISSMDYSSTLWSTSDDLAIPDNEPFMLPGNTGCIAANRLSYFYDLKGPSFTVDTACSSSLVAIHLACESLQRSESSMALAGGVQALIHPGIHTFFCKAGLLAPDGRCKSFDASADGYVRSEGAGIVLLKPYAKAVEDGDHIYAVIRGTAVNSDGRSSGMVAPNMQAQMSCIRKAYEAAGIDPKDTQYVEAHGTGTRQGDPIELRAIGNVLSVGREESDRCRVGSIKTNLGHSETAAGITGLIKAALCVSKHMIPPSLHFHTPNPSIDFDGLKLSVQTCLEAFPHPDREAIVGVSSFGFGGTNAHAVLSEPVQPVQFAPRYALKSKYHLLTLSARTRTALSSLASEYAALLRKQPSPTLTDLSAGTSIYRTHFRERIVCIGETHDAILKQLDTIASGVTSFPPASSIVSGFASKRPGKIAWLFTGQGSQNAGMAADLYNHHPTFRKAFEEVATLLDPNLSRPLKTLILVEQDQIEEANQVLAQTIFTQPSLFAVGYALARLIMSWGLNPDLVMGHSIGEILAAHLAGVFSLEDACRLLVARSKLMQELPSNGSMAAILAPIEDFSSWLDEEPDITIAAYNTPSNNVVSGPTAPLKRFIAKVQSAGLDVRPLKVSHAFHSSQMLPMLANFESEIQNIKFSLPNITIISNVTGEAAGPEIATADYWCEHIINPVQFQHGINTLQSHGAQVFLEIGPRPTLVNMARQCLLQPHLTFLHTLNPAVEDHVSLLNSVAKLYCMGYTIEWKSYHSPFPFRRIGLPGYPFEKRSYWWSAQQESPVPATKWHDHIGLIQPSIGISKKSHKEVVPLQSVTKVSSYPHGILEPIDLPGSTLYYQEFLSATAPHDLSDHIIRRQVVFPAAGFIESILLLLKTQNRELVGEAFEFDKPLKLNDETSKLLIECELLEESKVSVMRFYSCPVSTTSGGWINHGSAYIPDQAPLRQIFPFDPLPVPPTSNSLNISDFYEGLNRFGLNYGPTFRALHTLIREQDHAWAEIVRPNGGTDRGLLDSCFQIVGALLDPVSTAGQLLLPVGLRRIQVSSLPLPDRFNCQLKLRASSEPAFVVCDLLFLDGLSPFGYIEGFKLRRIPRQAFQWLFPIEEDSQSVDDAPLSWLIDSRWQLYHELGESNSDHTDRLSDYPLIVGSAPHQAQEFVIWAESCGFSPVRVDFSNDLVGTGPVIIWPYLKDSHTAESVIHTVSHLLDITKQLAQGVERPVWLILEGDGPAQGALEGFAKTAALEYPNLGWTRLHLSPDIKTQPQADDWATIWRAGYSEQALKWDDGSLNVARLVQIGSEERFRIGSSSFGDLEALKPEPLPPQGPLVGEVEIAVEATGLNFRDVLNALGLLASFSAELGIDDASKVPFGGECVGWVVAVGEGVDPEMVGQRVLAALAVGSLASHVICRADLCVPLPSAMSSEVGASVSTAFLTAIYGLETLAKLQRDETVLIHAAAGGVGQAALQIALRRGAHVIATASKAKHAGLLEQGVEAVFDSRTCDFSDQILKHTNSKGVDVVLNSLKGEWVDASFEALAHGGRFIELGKLEIWSSDKVSRLRPDVTYLPFDLLEVAGADPHLVRGQLDQILLDLQNGLLKPLPMHVFSIEKTTDAFRLISQARHIGKVVITQPSRHSPLCIKSDATYIVSGAFGGVGLQLLEWLAEQGAKSLIALSRSATKPGESAQNLLRRLEAKSISCACVDIDLGSLNVDDTKLIEPLSDVISSLPQNQKVRGIFHAAGILDDALIDAQTHERISRVVAPKLRGWDLLHEAVQANNLHESPTEEGGSHQLDFFISFSSMASLLGSPGQSNYSSANGGIDGASRVYSLQHNHSSSVVSSAVHLSIQWGPWAGAGMAGSLSERDLKRFEAFGVGLLQPESAFKALQLVMQRGYGGTIGVLNNDWNRIAAQSNNRQASILSLLVTPDSDNESPSSSRDHVTLSDRLSTIPIDQHLPFVIKYLQDQLGMVMGLQDGGSSIDSSESIFNLGLDSLMAVELAARVEKNLGVKLELEAFSTDPSLDAMAAYILRKSGAQPSTAKETDGIDLGKEAQLPNGWTVEASQLQVPGDDILLTGASGFLGAYLLEGQLLTWPKLRVSCIVRAPDLDRGMQRISDNMGFYGLWKPEYAERINVILGDLSVSRLGLDQTSYDNLASRISGIIHNGAYLSQMATYSQLAPTNVTGTRSILDLARHAGATPVHMISSVGVFEAEAYRDKELLETDDISEWAGIYNGYSQTKWVSERLVVNAGRRGLPIAIYRPPLIGGHSKTGAWRQDDLVYILLKGCLQLGMVPNIPWELDLVPVDYVSDAVTALCWNEKSIGRFFNLHNPQKTFLAEYIHKLIQIGAPFSIVEMPEWLQAMHDNPSNVIYPLRGFFIRRWGPDQLTYPELNQSGYRARPSAVETSILLSEFGVHCPTFDELIAPWASSLLSSNDS